MANKRMFALQIVDSDAFLDMPQSTQLLYFHLGMRADDDGFINNARTIMRVAGCKEDDMKLLIAKKFILPFESGIVVIKHWNINNYIQKDRYHETKYLEEKSQLNVDEKGGYTFNDGTPAIEYRDNETKKINKPTKNNVYTSYTQDRLVLDKTRLDKDSIDKNSISKDKNKEEKNLSIYSTIDSDSINTSKNESQIDKEKNNLNFKLLFTNYLKIVDSWEDLDSEIKNEIFRTLNDFKELLNNGEVRDEEPLYLKLNNKIQYKINSVLDDEDDEDGTYPF